MKGKNLTIIVAIALALVMICGGIAIYAVGEANEKRIGGEDTAKVTAEASIEPEAKVTPEPEAETNEDSQVKIPPPKPEAVEGEEFDEQVWKLQLADTPAYIGVNPNNYRVDNMCINGLPGTVDEELIAEFTEMLNGIRMRKVTNEEYRDYKQKLIQNSNYNDTSYECFRLYNSEGCSIGSVFFSRLATFEYGKDFYPAENPGWLNTIRVEIEINSDDPLNPKRETFIIDESTFDEELLERMWKECLCGVNPYDFITNLDEVTAGNNPYGRKPINLYNIDVIKADREDPNSGYDPVIAVPVD